MHDPLDTGTIHMIQARYTWWWQVFGCKVLLHSWRKLARHERAPLPKGTQKEKSGVGTHTVETTTTQVSLLC